MTEAVLSALDATFLELEQQDGGALMHIGLRQIAARVPVGAATPAG